MRSVALGKSGASLGSPVAALEGLAVTTDAPAASKVLLINPLVPSALPSEPSARTAEAPLPAARPSHLPRTPLIPSRKHFI
jgi:hypothetical protein